MRKHGGYKHRTSGCKGKKKYPEARARIIHDNGKQFISKDFKSLISLLELYETVARFCHPQSKGKLERFHSTLKTELVCQTAYFSNEDAKEKGLISTTTSVFSAHFFI